MTNTPLMQDDQRTFNVHLLKTLDELGIDYAIGGSLAAMAYSEPRLTVDIDLMINAGVDDLSRLVDEISRWEIYISPLESILETDLPLGLPINIVDGLRGAKADIYVAGHKTLDMAAMTRRRKKRIYHNPDVEAWFLSAEDVILYKLDYFRQSEGASVKHPSDIAKMLRVIGKELDLDYLEKWSAEIGVTDLWAAMWDEYRRQPGVT
jgi:hypothetical protein